ncbi:MAG: MFS transporter [Pirellulales bacterium]
MESAALTSARRKVYLRALPLLFVCYIIAYVDRNNVSVAQLTMPNTLPDFTKAVIGFGSGVFFLGYFLLEIPGTLLVERWSASKWICRIMVTWGFIAALTAFVTKPWHFYTIRFLLGLAEAGFFPGVIVYLTHWFPKRDRARALSIFLVASPIAMIVGNSVSRLMLHYGEDGNPLFMGLKGWQCVFIFWGIPAVILGVLVVFLLTDRPRQAKWLTEEERDALESEIEKGKADKSIKHMSVLEGLVNPNVLMLALAYFGVVTANYGIEIFLPAILEDWYALGPSTVTLLAIIPSILVMIGQLGVGWSSDHYQERRWHSMLPIVIGSLGLIFATVTQGNLVLTVVCFTIAATGCKAYMPAFWSLPNMYLTAAAAAGSIGLINSVGNLGGFLGPTVLGFVKTTTGSYDVGIYFLATTCLISVVVIYLMPHIYSRLSQLKGSSRFVVAGCVAAVGLLLFMGCRWWINEQTKPWGVARIAAIENNPSSQSLADSLEDWNLRRPKIRDVLSVRLEELATGCKNFVENPPKQVDNLLLPVLSQIADQAAGLKKELTSRLKEQGEDGKMRDGRYELTLAQGLEKADQIIKDGQVALRQIGK